MEKVVKVFAYIIFCAFWIPIGLFVWIGMLLRVTLLFVSVSLIAAISHNTKYYHDFDDIFARASNFFVQGFITNYKSLFSSMPNKYNEELGWGSFFRQLVLTIFFYLSMYFFYELKANGIQETWHKIVNIGGYFKSGNDDVNK